MAIVIYPDSKEVLTRLVIVESDRAFFKLTSRCSVPSVELKLKIKG